MTDDPFAAIAQQLAAIDPSVSAPAAEAATRAVLINHPRALRLLAYLEAEPHTATSGTPSMPRALHRIITRLKDHDPAGLRLPVCPGCSAPTVDPFITIKGGPLCQRCAHRAKRRHRTCITCAKRVLHTYKAAGDDYCPPCWNTLLPQRLDLLRNSLRGTDVRVSTTVLKSSLEAAESSPTKQLKLVLECKQRGRDLLEDPGTGSPAFARFYRALARLIPQLPPTSV